MIKDSVRSRLLGETELTLQKAIDVCPAAETSTQQMKVIQSTSSGATGSNVNIVKKKIVKAKMYLTRHYSQEKKTEKDAYSYLRRYRCFVKKRF